MKRIIIIIGVVLAVSCSKSQESPKVDDSMVTWVFKAPSTKASLNASGAFSWSKGDQIAIWDATSGSFITFTTGSGSGRFSATAPASANFTTSAFYPATLASESGITLPSSYTAADLSAGGGMPMFAAVEDNSDILNFKHLSAYITVQVNNLPGFADRISVGSPSVSLSGAFNLTDAGAGIRKIQASSGNACVTYNFSPSAGHSFSYTIPVPVGEYALYLEAGDAGTPDFIHVETDSVNFQRGHLYSLSVIDGSASSYTITVISESYALESDNSNWE